MTTVQEEAIKFQNENLAAAVSSHSRNLSRAVSRTVSRVPSRQVSRAVSRMGSRSSSMNSLYNLGKNEIYRQVVRASDNATVLGSIAASSDTVESEGRQMKQC